MNNQQFSTYYNALSHEGKWLFIWKSIAMIAYSDVGTSIKWKNMVDQCLDLYQTGNMIVDPESAYVIFQFLKSSLSSSVSISTVVNNTLSMLGLAPVCKSTRSR